MDEREPNYSVSSLISDEELREIHELIHSRSNEGKVGDEHYTIEIKNNCRSLSYKKRGHTIVFMEQNKTKQSTYAQEARSGKRITWGLTPGKWIYIDDSKIV